MQRNDNSIIWNPGELIYEIGNIPEEAYLILEGYVIIETKDKFQLNRLGVGEVFGETSLLLGTREQLQLKLVPKKLSQTLFQKIIL